MTNHRYDGEYTSAIVRCHRILKRNGFQISKHGRSNGPFAERTGRAPGVRVTRVGCSHFVTLHGMLLQRMAPVSELKELEGRALAVLRENGMPFDERGWLECRQPPKPRWMGR